MVACPICSQPVREANINAHLDAGCKTLVETSPDTPVASIFKPASSGSSSVSTTPIAPPRGSSLQTSANGATLTPQNAHRQLRYGPTAANGCPDPQVSSPKMDAAAPIESSSAKRRRSNDHLELEDKGKAQEKQDSDEQRFDDDELNGKRKKPKNGLQLAQPLAERMRPRSLDDIYGQELVGRQGLLRSLTENGHVPSMILWGGAGTGKTTIARVIANQAGARFVEINSTSSGVADCKKHFADARAELSLTGRKTIMFCDEIHRFSKTQQDVFLGPVEAGIVTLIGATTENPSFKVQSALLSRCRVFTLAGLTIPDLVSILQRALKAEDTSDSAQNFLTDELVEQLATYANGDARIALNLLEIGIDAARNPSTTPAMFQQALTRAMVYDRAGDQHYDTISAFHKSIRGSDAHAALYYLARMLQSGEDPLYIARRMIVIASEDIGLADHSMLSLATSTHVAVERVGLPEARINLAHCAVALALASKSTRAYRGLNAALAALEKPGVAALPIPIHLRNAPTRLLKELGHGKEYKYNPRFLHGKVLQDYLPPELLECKFLADEDFGTERDPDLAGLENG